MEPSNAPQAAADRESYEARAALVDEPGQKNRELEAFTYAVSHDLRAPLRAVRSFSQILFEEFGSQMPPEAIEHLNRIRAAAVRMGQLIDSLLALSRATNSDLGRRTVNVSELARAISAELEASSPGAAIECLIQDDMETEADPALFRIVLRNLLGNAWKFTAGVVHPTVQVGVLSPPNEPVFFVRDNGVGFDMGMANKLFQPFERLHPATEFPGAGIGLATVRRIVERHGGRIWAEAAAGHGATFYFTLCPVPAVQDIPKIQARSSSSCEASNETKSSV